MTQAQSKALIMAGGTGGHVFPALAVARALAERGAHVQWLGTARGIEAELVPAAGLPLHCITVEGVRGRGIVGLLKAPWLLLRSLMQALTLLRKERPDVVIGFGGFASGPGGVAARLLRLPLVIHEQNAIAGTTNRLLARIAARVLVAFPKALTHGEVVGNPVREDIARLPAPAQRFAGRGSQLRVLVLGGSLGAQAINQCLPETLAQIPGELRPQVWHQTGKKHLQETRAHYQRLAIDGQVDAFIDNMSQAYAWADLVICRAGALTISELMAVGLGAVLVPFPHAIDDHQTANAKILVDQGAALLVPQPELTPERLAALLLGELAQRKLLLDRAELARQLARPDAATQVADLCLEVIRG